MKTKTPKKDKLVTGIAVLAWSQFLVLLQIYPKKDLFPEHGDLFTTPKLAFYLTVAAISSLALPMLVYKSNWEKSSEQTAADYRGAQWLGVIGFEFWVFSILTILFNLSVILCGFSVFVIWVSTLVMLISERERKIKAFFFSLALPFAPLVWQLLAYRQEDEQAEVRKL